jgi:hypothetical protein
MSKHEVALRKRLAVDGADVYEIMRWFLEAVGAQACADGGPEPDLSWFEREFLKDNVERYHEERPWRIPLDQLLNEWATTMPTHPDRPLIDVSRWADKDLISGARDDCYGDSCIEELVKRANAKRVTMADYVFGVLAKNQKWRTGS